MLNLTLVQKHLSAFRNVHHHKGTKNFYLQSCASTYTKRKTKYNKGVTRTDDCLMSSHLPLDDVDSSEILQRSFISGRKLDRDTVLFVLRNRKLDMLVVDTLPKLQV